MTSNEARIPTFIGIQAPRLWMPDQVRHDESKMARLQLIVNRSSVSHVHESSFSRLLFVVVFRVGKEPPQPSGGNCSKQPQPYRTDREGRHKSCTSHHTHSRRWADEFFQNCLGVRIPGFGLKDCSIQDIEPLLLSASRRHLILHPAGQ